MGKKILDSTNLYYNGARYPASIAVQMMERDKALAAGKTNAEESKDEVQGETINEEVKEETIEEEVVENTEESEEVKEEETAETPVLTVEEMKSKLDEAGISYHHASGLPKLTELMVQNGLM